VFDDVTIATVVTTSRDLCHNDATNCWVITFCAVKDAIYFQKKFLRNYNNKSKKSLKKSLKIHGDDVIDKIYENSNIFFIFRYQTSQKHKEW